MTTIKNLLCLLVIGLCSATAYAGFPVNFPTPPPPCPYCPCPPGFGGSGGSSGSGGSGCPTCGNVWNVGGATGGMPDWKVNEPNIDLRLHDEPLAYQSSVSRMSFQIDYWQRDDREIATNVFTTGLGWECSWKSYVIPDGDAATLYGAGGGEMVFPDLLDPSPSYYYNLQMQALTDTNGNLSGYAVFYSSGAEDVYGFLATDTSGNVNQAYLSQKIDAHGHTTTFIYAPYNSTNGVVQLNYVIDPDGKTNTLSYTTNGSYNCLISQVQDPYGHTVSFSYDTDGYLTNVTDVAGLSSSFGYANVAVGTDWVGYVTDHWLDQLTTPYGTTSFTFTDEGLELDWYDLFYEIYYGYVSSIVRSVVITEPNGSHQMFAYDGYASFAPSNVDWSHVPSSTPDGSLLDDGAYMIYRNSFYWGRQQFANLTGTFLATGATNWDLTQLTPTDFLKGRWQHWLHSSGGGQSDALSMEQDPSPDGINPGEMTWFTYPGQPANYDSNGKLVSYYQGTSDLPTLTIKVLPDGSQWYEQYQMDQWGNRTEINSTYSSGGSVLTRTNSYVYSADGTDLLEIIGPDGITNAAYGYDSQHQVLFLTNALSEVTSYTYTTNEQPASITQPSGLVTTYTYGADNFLTQQIAVGYFTNSYTYANGLIYTYTDARGLTVTDSWDALQRLTNISYPDSTSVAYTYNKLDLEKIVDRMGFTTSYGYNAIRQKIAETNALSNVTSYSYCDCGALEFVTDPLGHVTHFTHDNQGNQVGVVYPDGYSVTNQYNLLRQLTQRTDSSGAILNYIYNNQGLPTTISNAVGLVGDYAFDIDDRITNNLDINGVSVGMTYDNLGRLLTRRYPDGGVENYGYTQNVYGTTSFTNQIGSVKLFGYDAMNRKTSEAYAGTTTNYFDYSGGSDLLALTNGKGQATIWHYDSYGRMTNKVDALNHSIFNYAYDADNRLTSRWTPENGNTFFTYDATGNPIQIGCAQFTNSYSYDALNHLTNMVDSIGATHFAYDAVGQLLNSGGLWANDPVSCIYTNRLRVGLGVGSAWSQIYSYDLARRIISLSSPAGAFGYNYNVAPASALVSAINLPNGATITNGYDDAARLTQSTLNNHWGHVLDGYGYEYDLLGERTNILKNIGLTGSTITAGYDSIGELTSWMAKEMNGAPRLNEQLGWSYDAAGNLQSRTNGGLVQIFQTDALNELTNVTRIGVLTVSGNTPAPATNVTVNGQVAQIYSDFTFASTNHTLANGNNVFTNIAQNIYGMTVTNTITSYLPTPVALAYDANGNLTNDGLKSFNYDAENQLTNVAVAGQWKLSIVYDGLNRRRIVKNYSWSGSVWVKTNEVRYIYDGNLVIQERDTNNNSLVTYTRGLDLSHSLRGAGGVGSLLARTDGIGSTYYHADGNGNITGLIDGNENVVARYGYSPFGKLLGQWGSMANANEMRFSSKEWDSNSGLYYYLYRFYDPNVQRWINRDPIAERGGINLYEFVLNNPVYVFDVYGLAWSNDPGGCPTGTHPDKNSSDCFDLGMGRACPCVPDNPPPPPPPQNNPPQNDPTACSSSPTLPPRPAPPSPPAPPVAPAPTPAPPSPPYNPPYNPIYNSPNPPPRRPAPPYQQGPFPYPWPYGPIIKTGPWVSSPTGPMYGY